MAKRERTHQRNLPERKLSKGALREIEERYRVIVETCGDWVSRHTLDGVFLDVSPTCGGLLGYKPEELLGHSPFEFYHPEDCDSVAKAREKILEQPIIHTFDYRIRCKDGRYIWLETVGRVVLSEETGSPIEIRASSRNVTERKNIESALRESQTIMETFFNSPGQLRGIVELTGNDILHVSDNEVAAAFFGTTREAMQNKLASQLGVPGKALSVWIDHYRESQRTRLPVQFDYLHPSKPRDLWFSATVSWVGNGPTCNPRFAYVISDITDRKLAEQEREELIRELQEADREVKTLSGLLPICANCKKIRDDNGYWQQIEAYIRQHSEAVFSHGICPDCLRENFPDLANELS